MNGAESLVRTLVAGGVDTCFANPGTSELHFVSALDRIPGIRCVLCLFEGVVTGAADGYARMSGRPACTLLHLGPGLANGLANLHNARRARVPILNIVGEHATYHRKFDAPLTSDIVALAGQFSRWIKTSDGAPSVGADTAAALEAATAPPGGGIATLILPADAAWGEGGVAASMAAPKQLASSSDETIERCAALLRRPGPSGILLGNGVAYGPTLDQAAKLAAATGATLFAPFSFSRISRGAGRPIVRRIPYVLEQALASLAELRQMVLIGAEAPVAFFAYPDMPSTLLPAECESLALTSADQDHGGALERLLGRFRADTVPLQASHRPPIPSGPITLEGLAAAVGALLPEDCIVVDESLTSGRGLMAATIGAPAHDWLVNTGGAIGSAMPLAVGAAIACPERPVLCLSADGSGMYTLQALWTMARENLRVTTVVFANRGYAILRGELAKLAPGPIGSKASEMVDIGRPAIGWVSLAAGLGVTARQVTTLDDFVAALSQGLSSDVPNLIEVVL